MTTTEDRQTAAGFSFDPCPSWCTGQHDATGDREHGSEQRFPQVYVSQWQDQGQPLDAVTVEVFVESENSKFTPVEARELAAELLRLADIAEGVAQPAEVLATWSAPAWAQYGPMNEHDDLTGYFRDAEGGWIRQAVDLVTDEASGISRLLLDPEPYLTSTHNRMEYQEFTMSEARAIVAGEGVALVNDHDLLARIRATFSELLAAFDAAGGAR